MTTWNQNKIPMIQAFMPEEGFLCWAPLDSISTKGVQQDQNQQTTSAKTQSFWQSCCSVRPGSHRDCPMAQTPTSYVESWKGKWTWNREGLQLPLIVAEAWPPKPGGWKKCFVSLPADGGGERERDCQFSHVLTAGLNPKDLKDFFFQTSIWMQVFFSMVG